MYKKLKNYIDTSLTSPSLAFKWTPEDNENFFIFLDKNFEDGFYEDNENLLIIKDVFKEYFEDVGFAFLQIKNDVLRIKILPYKMDVKDSHNIEHIVNLCLDREDDIIDNYNNRENQFILNESLRDDIFLFVKRITNEQVHPKELIKHSIREAFELSYSDIIILQKKQIFIKLIYKEKIKSSEDEKRFNGIDEDELNTFYLEFFSEEENRNLFRTVSKLFVDANFVEKGVDNISYETTVFGSIQSLITQEFINNFDENEEFFKGFAGFVFRKHFKKVFSYISEFILAELAISNENVIGFLRYYSSNIIIVNGIKYIVPSIESEEGLKWNVVSMMSIVKPYMKIKNSIKELTREIDKMDIEQERLYIDGISPLEYNKNLSEEQDRLSSAINSGDIRLEKHYDVLEVLDDEKDRDEKNEIRKAMVYIREAVVKLRAEKTKIIDLLIPKAEILEYSKTEKILQELLKRRTRENYLIEKNEGSFTLIKNALVKALIAKKKKL